MEQYKVIKLIRFTACPTKERTTMHCVYELIEDRSYYLVILKVQCLLSVVLLVCSHLGYDKACIVSFYKQVAFMNK